MSTKLGFLVKVWRGKGAALQAGSFTFCFFLGLARWGVCRLEHCLLQHHSTTYQSCSYWTHGGVAY